MFMHSSREPHGIRWWWHIGNRSCVHIEFYWWSSHFGLTVGPDDDGWNLSARVPPFALYLSLEGVRLWQPQRKVIATWDHDREIWLPDRREFEITVSDWRVRLELWGRWGEWRAADPWWIRGVSVDLRDLVLGKTRYSTEELALVPCEVPMPEGSYPAVAKIERATWKRPRWFATTRQSAWLEIPKGIPHAGKGENSWDCGDDGLFGIGGDTIEKAIGNAVASVLRDRRRYGHASEAAMREALER